MNDPGQIRHQRWCSLQTRAEQNMETWTSIETVLTRNQPQPLEHTGLLHPYCNGSQFRIRLAFF
jgi:hypothetical protein